MAGMSRDLGRDVRDQKNFMQENFGLIFHSREKERERERERGGEVSLEKVDMFFGSSGSPETLEKLERSQECSTARQIRPFSGEISSMKGPFQGFSFTIANYRQGRDSTQRRALEQIPPTTDGGEVKGRCSIWRLLDQVHCIGNFGNTYKF